MKQESVFNVAPAFGTENKAVKLKGHYKLAPINLLRSKMLSKLITEYNEVHKTAEKVCYKERLRWVMNKIHMAFKSLSKE